MSKTVPEHLSPTVKGDEDQPLTWLTA